MISIIIPVYNAENYIEKCLDKVLQIPIEKEVIVINDGSKDETLNKAKKYTKDIILLNNKQNKGVSYSRNLGIKKSTQKYLTFLDVDDDFEEDILLKMIEKIEKEQSDIVVANYDEINIKTKKVTQSKYTYKDDSYDSSCLLPSYLTDKISPAIWDKVYNTDFIKKISFDPTLQVGEDILFCLEAFSQAKKITLLNEVYYHYYQNDTSVMHQVNDKLLQFSRVTEQITSIAKEELNKFPKEYDFFKLQMYMRSIHSISMLENKYNHAQVLSYLQKLKDKKILKKVIKNDYFNKSIKLECIIIYVFGIHFHLWMMPFYRKVREKR